VVVRPHLNAPHDPDFDSDPTVANAELMGYAASVSKAQADTENIIQAAIKRGILLDEDGDISLLGRNISDYPRE